SLVTGKTLSLDGKVMAMNGNKEVVVSINNNPVSAPKTVNQSNTVSANAIQDPGIVLTDKPCSLGSGYTNSSRNHVHDSYTGNGYVDSYDHAIDVNITDCGGNSDVVATITGTVHVGTLPAGGCTVSGWN